jgi:hypothetical protein
MHNLATGLAGKEATVLVADSWGGIRDAFLKRIVCLWLLQGHSKRYGSAFAKTP